MQRGMDMTFKVFDAHCDALEKLWRYADLSFDKEDERLHVSLPEMKKGHVLLQVFAVFVPTDVPYGRKFHTSLEMVDIFHEKIAGKHLRPIYTRKDLDACVYEDKKGAILFVEGAYPLEGSLTNLRTLYRLGVRGMGLTWNFQNEVAAGCHEVNPGGLTLFGRKVVSEMNRLGMVVDVSHIAEPGFWDTLELSTAPIIASHANVKALYNHPRNLNDLQIKALIEKDGVMGLTLYPPFYTNENRPVTMDDLLRQLDHICSLGGVNHVGIGADFDGIDKTFADLDRPGKYGMIAEALANRYKEEEIKKFMCENWLRVFRTVLQ